MSDGNCELGIVGLGVMGRNLLLNMADHGYVVAGYDKDPSKVQALRSESNPSAVHPAENLVTMVAELRRPRAVMLLVPAGEIVDRVIEQLRPLLAPGDLIIDGGNSRFTNTDRRAEVLEDKGIHYIGMGVSGGEEGARHGPSMMPGGSREAYARVQPLFERTAANVDGDPCVAFLGPGSAGHYVKMVHNGIEYGLMQLIAETYDIMRRGLGFGNDQIGEVYRRWNESELRSFLIEITAHIFGRTDGETGHRLIDVIRDQAKQKGTGMWASQDAMELQSPTPTIDAAVTARNLSALDGQRRALTGRGSATNARLTGDPPLWVERLQNALYAAMIVTYAQGLSLLKSASSRYEYGVSLESVARIWRGGCIIRADLLEDIRKAYRASPELPTLLLDQNLGGHALERLNALRGVVAEAAPAGIPVPAFSASLAYVEGLCADRLPANLIQAQRDYFGSHTYERLDRDGVFHTAWRKR
jgi:6-phosphogluconate dehydrogenase